MADQRRHKAFVVTTDETWIAFRALCIVRGVTIEHALGRLVDRIVSSPAPMEPRAVIAAERRSRDLAEADARARSKVPVKRRAPNKRSSRPKRQSGS